MEAMMKRGESKVNSGWEKLVAKFQRHMAAATFAESGEHKSAQEMLEPLRSPKTVLLVVYRTAPDSAALGYALNLCQRTDAHLEILYVSESPQEEIGSASDDNTSAWENEQFSRLKDILSKAEIPYTITTNPGNTSQEVLNYLRDHREISTVILDSHTGSEAPMRTKRRTRLMRKIAQYLSVPVVTVLPREQESAAADPQSGATVTA